MIFSFVFRFVVFFFLLLFFIFFGILFFSALHFYWFPNGFWRFSCVYQHTHTHAHHWESGMELKRSRRWSLERELGVQALRFHRSLSLSLLPVFTDLWQMHFISGKQRKKMTKNIKPSHFIALSLIEKSNKKERRAEVQPSRVIRQMTTLFTAHVRVGDVGAAVVAVDASHISLIDLSIAIKRNSI